MCSHDDPFGVRNLSSLYPSSEVRTCRRPVALGDDSRRFPASSPRMNITGGRRVRSRRTVCHDASVELELRIGWYFTVKFSRRKSSFLFFLVLLSSVLPLLFEVLTL